MGYADFNFFGSCLSGLGHGDWVDKTQYKLQTLKDNLSLFTPEILDQSGSGTGEA